MPNPPRQKASDFDPEVLRLFDQYVHGIIDRRGFLSGAARFAVGATAAAGLLAALSPQFAAAQQVKPDDKRLSREVSGVRFAQGLRQGARLPGEARESEGALAAGAGRAREPRAQSAHRRHHAHAWRWKSFIAFAPDALFPLGGYPGDEDKARAEFAKLDQAKTREDFLAAADVLAKVEGGNGRLGVVGFCYGGGMANFLATRLPDLAAAAPFYGSAAPLEDVPKIKAEMLVVLAANDERINAGWPAYEAALKSAGVKYTLYQPAGTQHGFNNDTTPRYDETAAREAWRRTIALFDRTLRKG